MTAIYHITHVDNLAGIMQHGALVSDSRRRQLNLTPRSIAHAHIKDRRSVTAVTAGARGVVADYVPFYFCTRSPMLFAIHKGGAGTDGQARVLHLVAEAEAVKAAGVACCFADAHATTQPTQFHDNLARIASLRWDYINAQSWYDSAEHPDRKRRKQAEFLAHDRVPWNLIRRIGVCDAAVQAQVQALLAGAAHAPPVEVHRDWYY